jgi:hypothetical protein
VTTVVILGFGGTWIHLNALQTRMRDSRVILEFGVVIIHF